MAQDITYETIDRPYNSDLARSEVSVAENVSGVTQEEGGRTIKSGEALTDAWINTWIKSSNYEPKKRGFMLNGMEGYIECMKLYVGSGGIVGGSLDIPDTVTTNSFHVDATGNSWWGSTLAGGTAAANAYILNTGAAKFKNVILSDSVVLSGLKPGTEPSIQGWQNTGVFSATDYRTVAWTGGSIILMDGTPAYTFLAGVTPAMSQITYIYFNTATPTVLLTTTTASTAVGAGKILIAVAKNNTDTTSKATFQAFGGSGGQNILVDNIAANSASVNEFISNTAQIKDLVVTNAKINDLSVAKLTAGTISAQKIFLSDVTSGTPAPVLIDSYSETFTDTNAAIYLGGVESRGQTFLNSSLCVLNSAKFYIKKIGSPTGNVTARIYAHTGSYAGKTGTPTGAPLATSDNLDITTLTTSYSLETFTFSGVNKINLSASTNYVTVIVYQSGNASNYLHVGYDNSGGSRDGNAVYGYAPLSSWGYASGAYVPFYIYADGTNPVADCFIATGKTGFGQDSTNGFILGIDSADSSLAKFEIGSTVTGLLKYDGADLTLTGGTFSSGTITGTTITGGTIQTDTTGDRIVLADATNDMLVYDSSNVKRISISQLGIKLFSNNSGTDYEQGIISTDGNPGFTINANRDNASAYLYLHSEKGVVALGAGGSYSCYANSTGFHAANSDSYYISSRLFSIEKMLRFTPQDTLPYSDKQDGNMFIASNDYSTNVAWKNFVIVRINGAWYKLNMTAL